VPAIALLVAPTLRRVEVSSLLRLPLGVVHAAETAAPGHGARDEKRGAKCGDRKSPNTGLRQCTG
jgi:hypothetical protein